MPRVKIKQLEERVASAGVHFGAGPQRRKLEPGEIVDIPETELLPDGRRLFDVIWDTGKVEMTPEEPTRPLDYANYREARLCSPSFKPRDANEENEMHVTRQAVRLRMAQSQPAAEEIPAAGLDERPVRKPAKRVAPKKKGNPRARRRVARQTANHGQEITT